MSKILISGAGKRDPRDFHAAHFRIVREMSLGEEVMYRNDKEALKRLVMACNEQVSDAGRDYSGRDVCCHAR